MRNDLSFEAKQTFQIVAFLATILVVGIHYKSDVPDGPDPSLSTWNELGQEFLFGGIARVAVPLFAFAAGFFYFRSDDGSLACYRNKLRQRARSLALPYFLVSSVAMTSWLVVRRMEGSPVGLSMSEFLSTWLLRPPAEQLWFLRDLIVLVAIAPLIRLAAQRSVGAVALGGVALAWCVDWEPFPKVAGWHLLHLETLLFFALGFAAVSRIDWIERCGRLSTSWILTGWAMWCGLIASRIYLRADFDIWYIADHGLLDLLLHQLSILIGAATLFATAWRIRCQPLIRLSGAAFFVYLIHEFPLRAVVERLSDRYLDHSTSCWVLTPIVIFGCFSLALALDRYCPTLIAWVTGGRTPASAAHLSDNRKNNIRATVSE